MIVYKATCSISGKAYVGQTTKSLEYRWQKHAKRGHALYAAIKKYGVDSFNLEILEECNSIDELNFLEKYYIRQEKTLSPFGYNLTTGGEGFEVSDETRVKQSAAHMGKSAPWNSYKRSEETKAAMSLRQIGRPGYWTGKKRGSVAHKPIYCFNNGVTYQSARIAAKELGLSYSKISLVVNKLSSATKGYRFEFVGNNG